MSFNRYCFQCEIDSPSPFKVTWYKDGIPITSPDYEQRLFGNTASLTIEETFSEDTAVYMVEATNNLGSSVSSANLSVKGDPLHTFLPSWSVIMVEHI